MIYGRAQIFKISTAAACAAAPPDILTTRFAGYLGKLLATPKVVQSRQTTVQLRSIGLAPATVLVINRQDVRNVDLFYVAFFAYRLVFRSDVASELFFRCRNFTRRASCGDVLSAVEDDPGFVMHTFPVPAC
jgi:hypothetical protein